MALTAKSLFLYGLQVTASNRSLDFKASSGGAVLQATLTLGYYSLTDLMTEVVRAMAAVDTANTYTVTAARTFSGNTRNRVTIATSGAFLSLLFASGPRTASNCASLLGFTATDKTGATTYTGSSSCGTLLQPTWYAYNYLSTSNIRKVFGALNVSASGEKEAVIFTVQKFFQAQFKFEPQAFVETDWMPFLTWAIQQRSFEFTPQISAPNTIYNCTLETTAADGKGLSYTMKEQLPDFPFLFDTGLMMFRLKE